MEKFALAWIAGSKRVNAWRAAASAQDRGINFCSNPGYYTDNAASDIFHTYLESFRVKQNTPHRRPGFAARSVGKFRAGLAAALALACAAVSLPAFAAEQAPLSISGRYPNLAMFNEQGECGVGAVVPWSDRLWVITYGPHLPNGSDDKLYEIDSAMNRVVHSESVGGTPADRMIHKESNQLIIGPYFIDAQRTVRVVTPKQMPGRLTAAARHLTDPANKVYILDMEGMLYEVDVHTLAVKKLFARVAPGAHAKGGYTGQGRLIIANNGNQVANKARPALLDPQYPADKEASGILAEFDGKEWKVIERREFTDITGPGGIEGSCTDQSPVWAIGWDKRSVMLKLLDSGTWRTFRLPISDYSYVARHGWYTEWPRIRDVGNGKLLMNMHGGWFDFPRSFSASNTAGLRPIGDYLKITGDFAPWQNRIAFGCDDASAMQNPLLGQSQSNLWFATWNDLSQCGRANGNGGPWVNDAVKANQFSDPFLLAGYTKRMLHLSHAGRDPVNFTIEIDVDGRGSWKPYQTIAVPANGYVWHAIPDEVAGEWVRIKTDRDSVDTTAYFTFGAGGGATEEPGRFAALAAAGSADAGATGTLRPLGHDTGTLLFESRALNAPAGSAPQLLEVTPDMRFRPYSGPAPQPWKSETPDKGAETEYKVSVDSASAIISDGKGRYRLPLATAIDHLPADARALREVVTERFLLNVGGSFFMVPRTTAGGAMRLKPVCTHEKQIGDFCSWRGMMVMSGCRDGAKPDGHFFASDRGQGLWFGDIDDLWKMGKPRGHGGPWRDTAVTPDTPSDPFLMEGYDHKTLALSHDGAGLVHVALEVDVAANGDWKPFRTLDVAAGKKVKFEFPAGYSAHWIRLKADAACRATAEFSYD